MLKIMPSSKQFVVKVVHDREKLKILPVNPQGELLGQVANLIINCKLNKNTWQS